MDNNNACGLQTTLSQIKTHGPCAGGWRRLKNALGAGFAFDAPIDFITLLDAVGPMDTIWCLRAAIQDINPVCLGIGRASVTEFLAHPPPGEIPDAQAVARFGVISDYLDGKASRSAAMAAARESDRAEREDGILSTLYAYKVVAVVSHFAYGLMMTADSTVQSIYVGYCFGRVVAALNLSVERQREIVLLALNSYVP